MSAAASHPSIRIAGTEERIFFPGNRVFIMIEGKERHGVVTRVGRDEKVHVQCDDDSAWKCSPRAVRPSDKPAPARKALSFRKGDRVEVTDSNGVLRTGTVRSILNDGMRLSMVTDDGRIFKWLTEKFRPTAAPAPAKERVVNPFAKGDRVETDDKKDGVLYGLVASVRDEKITMDVDGGESRVRGHFKFFRMSKKPLIVQTDIPSAFDIYGVTKYKETPVTDAWEGHEGNGYSCIITKNGKPILDVFNEGVGGCSSVGVLKGVPRKEEDDFNAAFKAFYILCGGRECDFDEEYVDVWTEWYVHKKQWSPFAKEVKETTELCEGLGKGK
jgi:hypothetical protein